MAYVDIGDYRYTDIGNGEAKVQVRDETKTSYEDNILSQVNIGGLVYTVTSMNYCFYNCTNFNQSIIIPESVTDMSFCFRGCYRFNKPITIPNSVTNMKHCFRGCNSFNQPITIPENVDDMSGCFYSCFSLNQPIAILGRVINMDSCFRDCISFNQPITIPESVTDMSSCFFGCYRFNQPIIIPNNVEYMYYCFYNCTVFNQPIIIPESVTNMHSCFRGCISFNQPITISENVANMSSCFNNCSNFDSIVTFSANAKITDMSSCFFGCRNFNQPITIPESVIEMDSCFENCTNFNSSITFSENAQVISMHYCFYNCTNFNQRIIIPKSVTNMTCCFSGCANFNQPIIIPKGVISITYCFYNCTNFNQPITIPDSVTNMSYCFYGCLALANNITIQGSPTNIRDIFYNTGQQIYIINEAGSSIKDQAATYWRQIASEYSNVHYELDDHLAPLIKLEVKRANENGRPDSIGGYILIEKNNTIYQDFIPYGYEPATEHSERIEINGEIATPVPENPKLYLLNSETYTQKQIVTYTLNDGYREAVTTLTVSRLIALLDFQGYGNKIYDDLPGMGMAIGKIAERNGLEIDFPTAIGRGLLPTTTINYDYIEVENPTGNPQELGYYERVNEEYVLTEDTEVVEGKTYYEKIVLESVNLEAIQLLIGQFNKITNNSADDLFIIGNGTDENNRSNALVISKSPPYVYVDKQAAWRTALGLSDSTLTLTATDNTSFTTQMVHLT